MRIFDITESSKPDHVRASERKPKLRKPAPGGESPHPYQGRMVGEQGFQHYRRMPKMPASELIPKLQKRILQLEDYVWNLRNDMMHTRNKGEAVLTATDEERAELDALLRDDENLKYR